MFSQRPAQKTSRAASRATRLTLTLAMAVPVLTACSAQPPEHETRHEQRFALQSWHRCIQRESWRLDVRELSAVERCEGHRRDVIASFPPHLANRIDGMLSQHVLDKRSVDLRQVQSLQGTRQLDAVIKARQGDL